jgi:hypothetical protein
MCPAAVGGTVLSMTPTKRRFRDSFTFANIASVLALSIALGTGGAYAAGKIGSKDIAKNAVKAKHIAKKAVKSKKIAPKAVTSKQLANGAVQGQHLAPGAAGLHQITLRKVGPSVTAGTTDGARAAAQRLVLFRNSSFTISAKCFKENSNPANPGMRAEVYLEAGTGTVFSSGEHDSSNGFILPAETERRLADMTTYAGTMSPGSLNILDSGDSAFWAAHGSRFIQGDLAVGTKLGSPAVGNGVFGSGDRCLFAGTIRTG